MKHAHLKFIILSLGIILALGSCKSKKKALEAANAEKEKARIEAEAKARAEEEALRAKEEEAAARAKASETSDSNKSSTKQMLSGYFDAISSNTSGNSANQNIEEALALFQSPETPVLIVIHEENGAKDYDRPTTIRNYLNYLKDQKKNMNRVSNMVFDDAGKIKELELIRK